MIQTRTHDLREMLRRADLTPEQFARCLNTRAAQLQLSARVDSKTPYKWLRGSRPRHPWPSLACIVLSEALAIKFVPDQFGWPNEGPHILYVPADSGLNVPWNGDGAIRATREVMEESPVDRRLFMQLSGLALTNPAFEWLLAHNDLTTARSGGARRVRDTNVDTIDEMTAQLRRMDDQFGGGSVLDLVKSQVRFVVNLIDNYSYTDSVGIRLHSSVAELMRLGGWLSFDSGKHSQAQRLWIAALHAAQAAGDRGLGANILGFMSCQAKDLQMYDEAIKLAEAARRGYPGSSPTVRAILASRAAQAYAQTRDTDNCRRAIDSAHEALTDNTTASENPSWSYWFDEAQFNEQAGYSLMRLTEWKGARAHLQQSVTPSSGDQFTREGAMRNAFLAITYAHEGAPEQACITAHRAIDVLAEAVDSERCVGHVRSVQEALKPYRRTPAVREFDERATAIFGAA